MDASGNLLIADTDNNRIRKVNANGVITTVAGNGNSSYSGDGGAATNASLNRPSGVSVDASGNLFIADSDNNRIRKVNAKGVITTAAGNGNYGYSGDGGAATDAMLRAPQGIAVDATGNLFIADQYNNCIREVSTNGTITTVAGNGTYGYSGDGGVATNATFYYPFGVTLDATGNLFIADTFNNRIRKLNTNGIVTTCAGNGYQSYSGDGGVAINAALFYPQGIVVDNVGNLFVADSYNARIRKVDASGTITTVAGNGIGGYSGDGGAATNASISVPEGVAVDGSGNLLIADTDNNRIRKVYTNGIITTFAGNGNAGYSGDGGAPTNASLSFPEGVAVDASGNMFIADTGNQRIREVNANGIITTIAGNGNYGYFGDNVAATNATLSTPDAVVLDPSGNLFIADTDSQRIRKVPGNGPSLSINNILPANFGTYSILIINSSGSVTSSVASLDVILSPASRTNNASSTATFTATAFNPESLNFQWQKNGTNLVNGGNVSGATNSTLNLGYVQDTDAAIYSAVVSDATCSVTTSNAVLTINDTLMFATQPQSQTNLIGRSAAFNVVAFGVAPFLFQWYFNNVPVGSPTGGTNNSTYTILYVGTNQAGNYSVEFINDAGSVISSNAVLTVAVPPIITAQPLNRTNNVSTTATFSVTAASVLPLSYQWQQNGPNLINGGKFSGATATVLTITDVSSNEAAIYSVIVTNQAGSSTSSNASLTLTYPPSITAQPSSLLVLTGTNVSFGTTLIGAAPFCYNWRFNDTNLLNATNAIYAISPVLTNNAGNYSVIITNGAGSVTSSVAVLTVLLSPTNQVRAATSNATFTVVAFNPVALAYQWLQNGTNLVNGGKFSGATTNILTITGVSSNEAAIYAVMVTNAAGSLTSSNATLAMIYPPVITAQPLGQRLVLGNGVLFNVAVTGTAPYNYQWLFNAGNLLNATNAIYAIQSAGTNNTGNYSVVVTNLAGSATSSNALLVVLVPPSLVLQLAAGYPLLNLDGMLSNNFVVQYNTDLTTTNWITLQTFSNLLASPYLFLDPAGSGQPARFYRVLMQ